MSELFDVVSIIMIMMMLCYKKSLRAKKSNKQRHALMRMYPCHATPVALSLTTVAKSTCEAEYMGQSDAGSEIVWLRGILTDLGIQPNGPTTLFADNQGAIRLANNPENHRRTKHIAVKYHYTRELVESDTLKLVYKETRDMLADCLTKPLGRTKFEPVLPRMGLFPIEEIVGGNSRVEEAGLARKQSHNA